MNFKDVVTRIAEILNESDYMFHRDFDEFKTLYNELVAIVETNKNFTKTL